MHWFHPSFVLLAVGTALAAWLGQRRGLRRGLQLFFANLLVVLFWLAARPGRPDWPLELFVLTDPLVALVSAIASRLFVTSFLLALPIALIAVVMGRVYCSHACPLGTLLDLSDRFLAPKKLPRPELGATKRKIKYLVTIALLGAALSGANLLGFADPIVILTRTLATVFYPLAMLVYGLGHGLLRLLAGWLDWTTLSYLEPPARPTFEGALVMALLLATLLLLSRLGRRFWCRALCPLGGLIGWLGRWAPYRRRLDDDRCSGCQRCARQCPVGALADDGHAVGEQAECIVCRQCADSCPESAVRFGFTRAVRSNRRHQRPDLRRRAIVGGALGGVGLALAMRADIARASDGGRLIRPPGSLPEPQLLARCLRCGACMRGCPTNTLQPDWTHAGLEGLWTPRMNLRHAHCDQSCNVCGRLCPTEAIRPLGLAEKRHARVGTATVARQRCLPWSRDQQCLVCEERCPYGAITLGHDADRRHGVPTVDGHKCNGCGRCEQRCPVVGEAAIVVVAHSELRLARGSYKEACRERRWSFEPKRIERPFRLDDDALPGQLPRKLRP